MTENSVVEQKIREIDTLLGKQQFEDAFELLSQLDMTEVDTSSKEAGHLLYFSAFSLHKKSKHREALVDAQRAFDILRETGENKRVGHIQVLLGDIYCDMGDLKNAEREYRDALALFRRIEDIIRTARLCNRLARICFVQSDFEKAVEYLKDGIREARESDDSTTIAKLTVNLGTVYRYLGKWQLGEETHLLALDISRRANDKLGMARLFFTLGYLFFLQRRFSEAQDYYRQGFELVTEVGNIYESSTYYEYQGELCFIQGDLEKAKEHYNKALQIGERIAPEGDIINQTCRLLAELELAEGNLDEAVKQCERSLTVSLKLGDRFEEGITYKILGQIYLQKNDHPKSREYFEESIKLLKEIKAIYELGRSYLEAGKLGCFSYFERLKFLGNAQDLFGEVETRYHLACTHLSISELLYENGEFNKAVSFANEAEDIFKRLDEKEKLHKASSLKAEIEKKVNHLEDGTGVPDRFCFSGFLTQNRKMLDVIKRAQQVKDKDVTILIQGETGTGKDLLARMIHYNSIRAGKRFVALNCANLPEALLESELFGHKKGAFTGATQDKKGLLEAIDGGTLFLNEIGELPPLIQAKLLTVLEEKEFTRLGDINPRKVDIRIMAATNKDLDQAVQKGAFREDLYYRLSVIRLDLPPLRERKEDIKPLVGHFLDKHADGNKDKILEASNTLSQSLADYHWPGNVRELENEIIKLSTLVETKDDDGLDKLVKQIQKEKNSRFSPSLLGKRKNLERVEIINALKESNNVKRKAANLLEIPESTLRRKLKKLDITP